MAHKVQNMFPPVLIIFLFALVQILQRTMGTIINNNLLKDLHSYDDTFCGFQKQFFGNSAAKNFVYKIFADESSIVFIILEE